MNLDQLEAQEMARISAQATLRERQRAGLPMEPRERRAAHDEDDHGPEMFAIVTAIGVAAFVVIAVCWLVWRSGVLS